MSLVEWLYSSEYRGRIRELAVVRISARQLLNADLIATLNV